ncbi:unnamed protein product, partial [Laminaria digitata]
SYDHRPSHPYKAGTEHVGFSPTRKTSLAPRRGGVVGPDSRRRNVSGFAETIHSYSSYASTSMHYYNHRHSNAVRGHRTGPNNSGVEDCLRRKKTQQNNTQNN